MKNKVIGLVFALDIEMKNFIPLVNDIQEDIILNKSIYHAKYLDYTIVFAKAGIGKVNASIVTGIMIEHYNATLIINSGIAGGTQDKVHTLDTIIGSKIIYSDVDMTKDLMHFEYGQLQGYPRYFEFDNSLSDLMKEIDNSLIFGTIMSGDQFVTDKNYVDNLLNNYFSDLDVIACDMESGGIAQVCYANNVNFIIIRTISDVIGNNNQFDYYKLCSDSANKSLEIVKKLLLKL